MTERLWMLWYRRLPPAPDEPLPPAREARIRELGEQCARDGTHAIEETHTTVGDLLAEIDRLRPLLELMDAPYDRARQPPESGRE
ncbi:hypothetical protein CP973_09925 [Streptomyces albofaciens JCM 4342]|uniref:hypothetical protein n=1 Tax=Streptomyces albofaciens TaxID=66866 RepID=UPI00123BA509|nr:hypothetical protein [Streptomyces albofaciens]KAA6222222.1 hypothetical protein CP973_09925 [Streptomyces albofaciens JCM 4342]